MVEHVVDDIIATKQTVNTASFANEDGCLVTTSLVGCSPLLHSKSPGSEAKEDTPSSEPGREREREQVKTEAVASKLQEHPSLSTVVRPKMPVAEPKGRAPSSENMNARVWFYSFLLSLQYGAQPLISKRFIGYFTHF